MVSKYGEIFNPDDSTKVRLIFFTNLSQDSDFHEGLLNEFLAAFGYFEGQQLFILMIIYLDHFTEWALIDGLDDFISICNVVTDLIPIKLTSLRQTYSSV